MKSNEKTSTEAPRSDRATVRLLGLALVAVAIALFVLQNRERQPVEFAFFEINSRQWVNLAVAVGLGVVLDRTFTAWRRHRRDDD